MPSSLGQSVVDRGLIFGAALDVSTNMESNGVIPVLLLRSRGIADGREFGPGGPRPACSRESVDARLRQVATRVEIDAPVVEGGAACLDVASLLGCCDLHLRSDVLGGDGWARAMAQRPYWAFPGSTSMASVAWSRAVRAEDLEVRM